MTGIGSKALWILILLVFVPSLLIRLHPKTSESFQYDAVVSQIAAREGVVANAWDTHETFQLRRFHPPLLSYIIELNNGIFGDDPFGARIFSIVLGSLTCLVVAIAIAVLLPPLPGRLPGAVLGGWLLCLLPVHLYVSRTSNWDAVYGFFATASLLCLASYAASGSTIRLHGAALFGSLAFMTCELGLALMPAVLFVLMRDATRTRPSRLARRWMGVALCVVVLFALLWPAGLFKLDLPRALLYRWRDSAAEQRNLPWYEFYTTLFRQSPAFTVFVVSGIVATLLLVARGARAIPRSPLAHVFVVSLPFWIYVTTAFLLSLKQRLVYLHHIVDMFPPLVIAVCIGLVIRTGSPGRIARYLAPGLGAAVLILSLVAAFNPDPKIVGPQEHPGFLGVRDVLRDHPGSRIYCYDTIVLGYYLPLASIEGGTSRLWTPDDAERIRRERYDFVVFDRAKLNHDHPTPEEFARAFAPDYRVRWVINHRRTGEPVAWILSTR